MAEGGTIQFVGRKKEIDEIVRSLAERKWLVNMVTGARGMGTSILVEKALDEYKQKGYEKLDIVYIDCKQIKSEYDFMREILKQLGISTASDTTKDLSDYKAIAESLVECVTPHLLNNSSRPNLFFLDNVNKTLKEVVLKFMIDLLTQREKPQNVNFILTSVYKLRSAKINFKMTSLQGFTNEETRKLFMDNFGLEVTEKFLEVINRHYSGNPMLLQLVGNDMRCEDFMNQEDVRHLVEAGRSRDIVNRENMEESEQWDKVLKEFYKVGLSRETQERLHEVMEFDKEVFRVEDCWKDPKQAALAKNRLLPLIRSNAVELDPESHQIRVPPINKEFVEDQEEYAKAKGEHHFPYQDPPVKEIGKLSLDEKEEVRKEDSDEECKGRKRKQSEEDASGSAPSVEDTVNDEDHFHATDASQNAPVDPDGRRISSENNAYVQNNFDNSIEKKDHLKLIETSISTVDQARRFEELKTSPDNSKGKDLLEKTSDLVNIPVKEDNHALQRNKQESIEENYLQTSSNGFDKKLISRKSSFDDPGRLKLEKQKEHNHQLKQDSEMFSQTDLKSVDSERHEEINPRNLVKATNVGEQEEQMSQMPYQSQGLNSAGPQAMPLRQQSNDPPTDKDNKKPTNRSPLLQMDDGAPQYKHPQRYRSSTSGQPEVFPVEKPLNIPKVSGNTQNQNTQCSQATGHFQPAFRKENQSAHQAPSLATVPMSSNIPYFSQLDSSKGEDASRSLRSGPEDSQQHQGQVPGHMTTEYLPRFSMLNSGSLHQQPIGQHSMNVPSHHYDGMNIPSNPNYGMNIPTHPNYGMNVQSHQNIGMNVPSHQNIGMNVQSHQNIGMNVQSHQNYLLPQQHYDMNGQQWQHAPTQQNYGMYAQSYIQEGISPETMLQHGLSVNQPQQGLFNPERASVSNQVTYRPEFLPSLSQSSGGYSVDLAQQRQTVQDNRFNSYGGQSIRLTPRHQHPSLFLQQQQQYPQQLQHLVHQQQQLQQRHQLQPQVQHYQQLQQQHQEYQHHQLSQQRGPQQSFYNQRNNFHWEGQ